MDTSVLKKISLLLAGTLSAGLLLLATGRNASGESTVIDQVWTYEWSAAATGAPAAWYVVQFVVNGRDTTLIDRVGDTRVSIPVTLGDDYKLRVAGVTATGLQGPWSNWSELETFEQDPPTNTSGAKSDR